MPHLRASNILFLTLLHLPLFCAASDDNQNSAVRGTLLTSQVQLVECKVEYLGDQILLYKILNAQRSHSFSIDNLEHTLEFLPLLILFAHYKVNAFGAFFFSEVSEVQKGVFAKIGKVRVADPYIKLLRVQNRGVLSNDSGTGESCL